MVYIKESGRQPDSGTDRASTGASNQKIDTTAPASSSDWSIGRRGSLLSFAFSPPTDKKEEAPTTETALAQTENIPTPLATALDFMVIMEKQTMDRRRQLVSPASNHAHSLDEIRTAPIFTESVRDQAKRQASTSGGAGDDQIFSQYGLLAGDASDSQSDELFYYNVAAPSSTFICGSQGSGKSHTLSCLLENSLLQSVANELPRPLTGIVFHYDTFIGDSQGSPCEAAYLSTNPTVRVRVLCAPTNIAVIRRTYAGLPRVAIEPLRIREQDLTTKRMMDLMAMRKGEGMPLYMHVVNRVLRDLRLHQQQTGAPFDYRAFKAMLDREELTDSQKLPLNQRLETLESFMAPPAKQHQHQPQPQPQEPQQNKKKNAAPVAKAATDNNAGTSKNVGVPPGTAVKTFSPYQEKELNTESSINSFQSIFFKEEYRKLSAEELRMADYAQGRKGKRSKGAFGGNDWAPRAGQLTIVDLSCPCVTPEGACSLFNICLSLFLEQDAHRVGRVVALDEAHKYMNESSEASALTEQLLATIRLQRHLGARVVISTQEPTVSPRLLDLCSITVVHRFTSPEWLRALRRHLAGAEETVGMLARAAGGGIRDHHGADLSDSGVDDALDEQAGGVGGLRLQHTGAAMGQRQAAANLFAQIVGLRVGEALVFSPNAVMGLGSEGSARKLSSGVLKVRVRNRVTEDGGRSVMAG